MHGIKKRGISKASSVANHIAAFAIKHYLFSNRDLGRQRSSTEAPLMTHRSTKHKLQQKLCLNGRKAKELKAVTKVLELFTKWKAHEIKKGKI